MTLNRLLNADNECVGYFTDDAAGRAAMQAARAEWNAHGLVSATGERSVMCRSVATPIKSLELEDVEPGDGDRVDCLFLSYMHAGSLCLADFPEKEARKRIGDRTVEWIVRGAASVDVRRHEINRYRRPSKSNRDAELGGPEQAAGVLYVLTVRAPK